MDGALDSSILLVDQRFELLVSFEIDDCHARGKRESFDLSIRYFTHPDYRYGGLM